MTFVSVRRLTPAHGRFDFLLNAKCIACDLYPFDDAGVLLSLYFFYFFVAAKFALFFFFFVSIKYVKGSSPLFQFTALSAVHYFGLYLHTN